MDAEWPSIRRFLKSQVIDVEAHFLRARCALAEAAALGSPAARVRYLRVAQRDARHLLKYRILASAALAALIRAGIASLLARPEESLKHLESATDLCAQADMGLLVAVARRRRGELLGGDEGNALVREATRWMNEQEIVSPPRITALYAPGIA